MVKGKKDRSRSWCLTQSCAKMTKEELMAALGDYVYIAQTEKGSQGGEQGYEHFQIYIENPTAIRFETLKNKLPNAHIAPRRGTKKQAYDYVTKSETRIGDPFGNGEIDITETRGARNDITDILEMIRNGATDEQIEWEYPTAMFRYSKMISEARQRYLKTKYQNTFRELTTTYIYGKAGSGKTRYVMEQYGYSNVYRVIDWQHPFDGYEGQSVIMFEEFRSSLKIEEMLNYLDGYPLTLPARYSNKIACFDTVYIVTNIPLEAQYVNVQQAQPETWRAFLRRIKYLWNFDTMEKPELRIDMGRRSLLEYLQPTSEDLPF